MHRIDSATRAIDLFGSGKPGYTEGDPGLLVPATATTADHLNALQEEPARLIEAFSGTLSKADNTQLLQALQRAFREYAAGGWVERTTGVLVGLTDVASNTAGLLVAVGAASGGVSQIATSTDGVTWTIQANPGTVDLNAVCWSAHHGLFVAVGKVQSGAGVVLASTDGVTWARFVSGVGYALEDVAVSPAGLFLAVGLHGSAVYSSDGYVWSTATPGAGTSDLYTCAWGSTFFFATGAAANNLYKTSNCTAWTTVSPVGDGEAIVWTGTHWIVTRPFSAVAWSTDGITWTNGQIDAVTPFTVHAFLTDGAGLCVAVGDDGRVAVTRGGASWRLVAGGVAADFLGGCWCPAHGGYWVVAASSGNVLSTQRALG